jgi:hypothetical protein
MIERKAMVKNFVPPIIENMIERLHGNISVNEKENLCQTLQAISLEIDKAVRNARASMNRNQIKLRKGDFKNEPDQPYK